MIKIITLLFFCLQKGRAPFSLVTQIHWVTSMLTERLFVQSSRDMWFPTMWYGRPAKAQISLQLRAVWSEPLPVAWIFYYSKANDRTAFGDSTLKGGCTGSPESTHVKMPHCWKAHVAAHSCCIVCCRCYFCIDTLLVQLIIALSFCGNSGPQIRVRNRKLFYLFDYLPCCLGIT